jgi:four helix bundle protein
MENNTTRSYRDLLVWQKGIELAKLIYPLSATFPADERFGLTSQIRRASVSVASNIAEGQARHTTGEFVQFISHAEGSVAEVDTQLQIAVELEFVSKHEAARCFELISEQQRMLNGLRRKLTNKS